ncbi:MAG TPA: hypothetical protein PLO67_06860 [Saprospiraceae bacterium]|nr:hypothetical protein [Saprospiraceae bacterium]HPI06094.1 hypothetical protein [Saprospiraceae bacterium]
MYTFPKPVTVLRYFPQEIIRQKAEYRALPSRLPEWEKSAVLTNGFVREQSIYLQRSLLENTDSKPADTLLLQGTSDARWINLSGSCKISHFLHLHRRDDGIWIELVDDYYPLFGSKARDRYDILPLTPGKSAAIHINARYWHTLAGARKDTHYLENYLYLENLGTFEEAVLVESLQDILVFQPEKEVDLREMMY